MADMSVWCSGKLCVSNLLTLSSGFDVLWVGESLCCCTCVVLRSVPFTRYHLYPPHPVFTSHHSPYPSRLSVQSSQLWMCVRVSVICAFYIRAVSAMDVVSPGVSLSVINSSHVLFFISDDMSVLYNFLFCLSSCTEASFAPNQMFLCSADWP